MLCSWGQGEPENKRDGPEYFGEFCNPPAFSLCIPEELAFRDVLSERIKEASNSTLSLGSFFSLEENKCAITRHMH